MKPRNPKQKLLDEVFASDVEPSLVTVRRIARRRRWFRYGRAGATTLLAVVAGCLLFRERRPVEKQNVANAPSSVALAASSPLATEFLVRSAGDAVVIVRTEAFDSLVVTTRQTTTEPERIDDERLLLFAPGAILVRINAHSAGLVFPEHDGLPGR